MELRSGDNETIFDYAINDFNKDIFNLVFEVDCRQACMDALMHRSDDHDSVLETMIDELKDFDYEYLFGNDNTSVSENVDAMKDFLLKEDSYVIRTLHEQNDDLLSTIQESLKKTMVHAVDSQRSIRSDARDYIEVDDDASENEIENKIDDLTHDHDGYSHAWDVENACKDVINAIDEVRSKTTELVEKYNQEFPNGTPLVVACEMGRLDDVKTFVNAGMDVNQVGKNSKGVDITPLMAARGMNVLTLRTFASSDKGGCECCRCAIRKCIALQHVGTKRVKVVKMLMDHMTLDSINKKMNGHSLPWTAHKNNSPNRQQMLINAVQRRQACERAVGILDG